MSAVRQQKSAKYHFELALQLTQVIDRWKSAPSDNHTISVSHVDLS